MNQKYGSANAFRTALEQRLKRDAQTSGIRLDRLRRQVMVEQFLSRIEAIDRGKWVLKGAVALEVRLGSQARATADVDFGLREPADGRIVEFLSDRLISILRANLDDYFDYRLRDIRMLAVAEASDIARARVAVRLAGREFGGFQIDIALRSNELGATERIRLPGRLQFAGIDPVDIEVIALARHVAEK